MKKLQPPWKKSPHSFPATALSKLRSSQAPPLFENLVGGSAPPPNRGGGGGGVAHCVHCHIILLGRLIGLRSLQVRWQTVGEPRKNQFKWEEPMGNQHERGEPPKGGINFLDSMGNYHFSNSKFLFRI